MDIAIEALRLLGINVALQNRATPKFSPKSKRRKGLKKGGHEIFRRGKERTDIAHAGIIAADAEIKLPRCRPKFVVHSNLEQVH